MKPQGQGDLKLLQGVSEASYLFDPSGFLGNFRRHQRVSGRFLGV